MLTFVLLVCRQFTTIVILSGFPLLVDIFSIGLTGTSKKSPERKQKGNFLSLSNAWVFSPYEKQKEACLFFFFFINFAPVPLRLDSAERRKKPNNLHSSIANH